MAASPISNDVNLLGTAAFGPSPCVKVLSTFANPDADLEPIDRGTWPLPPPPQ